MKLIPIFVDEQSAEGLYAIKYAHEEWDEFRRLFNLWNDHAYLSTYLYANLKYLAASFFEGITIDQAREKIENEAAELDFMLRNYCEEGFDKKNKNLQMLFQPLNDKVYRLVARQESKAKLKALSFRKPFLRIYAIRIGVNTFIVTGGAIKFTHKMEDHEDTRVEIIN